MNGIPSLSKMAHSPTEHTCSIDIPLFLLEVQDFIYLNLTKAIFKQFNFYSFVCLFYLFIYSFVHIHMHACMSTICIQARGSQKKTSDPLKLIVGDCL